MARDNFVFSVIIKISRLFIGGLDKEHQEAVGYKNALRVFGEGVKLNKKIEVVDASSWPICTGESNSCDESCKNSNVKGCLAMPDKHIEGNIKKYDIIKIWNSKKAFAYNRGFDVSMLKGKCKTCEFNTLCRGGCKAFNSCLGGIFQNKYCNLILTNGTR